MREISWGAFPATADKWKLPSIRAKSTSLTMKLLASESSGNPSRPKGNRDFESFFQIKSGVILWQGYFADPGPRKIENF